MTDVDADSSSRRMRMPDAIRKCVVYRGRTVEGWHEYVGTGLLVDVRSDANPDRPYPTS